MYQVYAELNSGEIQKIGKPQQTKANAHDFCKTCMAILDSSKIKNIYFDELKNDGDLKNED